MPAPARTPRRVALALGTLALAHGLHSSMPAEWWFGQPGVREVAERVCAPPSARGRTFCKLLSKVQDAEA